MHHARATLTRTPSPRWESGRTTYGHAVGALMLDTSFPRPPGDIGNATTWPFPMLYRVVAGAHPSRVVGDSDPALLEPFVEAALELVDQGVRAVTTSCGFLALFQRELAAAVPVPVVSSALLQVPTAATCIGKGAQVGILTERVDTLTERHFGAVGWSSSEIDVVIGALAPDALFPVVYSPAPGDTPPLGDSATFTRDVVSGAVALQRQNPSLGALVLECTNFVPYSQAVREATGLPVYDLYTAVLQAYGATTGVEFAVAGTPR